MPKQQASRSSVVQLIRELEERGRRASLNGDASHFEKCASQDFLAINPRGEIQTKSESLEGRKAGHMKFNSLVHQDVQVREYGDTALVTGRSTVKGQFKGKPTDGSFRFSRLYMNKGGQWKLFWSQSTRIAPGGPEVAQASSAGKRPARDPHQIKK